MFPFSQSTVLRIIPFLLRFISVQIALRISGKWQINYLWYLTFPHQLEWEFVFPACPLSGLKANYNLLIAGIFQWITAQKINSSCGAVLQLVERLKYYLPTIADGKTFVLVFYVLWISVYSLSTRHKRLGKKFCLLQWLVNSTLVEGYKFCRNSCLAYERTK